MAAPAVSVAYAALACRCPRCGLGRVFVGVLTVRPSCAVCGFDLGSSDVGDGPVVFVVLLLGSLDVGLAFWVDFTWQPPLWVHAVLWPAITVPLAILLMRPLKAALIALQYRYRPADPGA